MELENKRIVITGAASGIGKSTLEMLSNIKGVKILAADLNHKEIHVKDNIVPVRCDVSLDVNIRNLISEADRYIGGIDIFFANAGFAYYEKIKEADWGRIDRIYRTNVYSPMFTVVELNIKRKDPFLFIVTASAMSHLPLPGYAIYSSTKSAVDSFMEAYRYEMKKGNRLMIVYPIATRTQFFDAAGKKVPVPFPSQTAEKVAKKIIKGIRSDKNTVYPSLIFRISMFIDRFLFFPLKIYQWIEYKKVSRTI